MGLGTRAPKKLVPTGERFSLALVDPNEVSAAMAEAANESFEFVDMSATTDATGKVRVALLFGPPGWVGGR
jgi:hypothetical protein